MSNHNVKIEQLENALVHAETVLEDLDKRIRKLEKPAPKKKPATKK